MQLVCLRKLLLADKVKPEYHDLLKMGLLAILIPVSNAKHNHVSLTFAEKPLETVDVGAILRQKYAEMLEDLRRVRKLPCAEAIVYRGNSRFLTTVLPKCRKASAVITSPPYPTVSATLGKLGPICSSSSSSRTPKAVGQLETDAIGGTWGKATSVLAAGVEPKNETVRTLLMPYLTGHRHQRRPDGELCRRSTSTTCTITLAKWRGLPRELPSRLCHRQQQVLWPPVAERRNPGFDLSAFRLPVGPN